MARNLQLEECLIDKAARPFESLPEFAETVAFVHKFGELLGLTTFSYADLQMELLYYADTKPRTSSVESVEQIQSLRLLENLIAEVLHFFSFKFDRHNLFVSLHKLIKRLNQWCLPKFEPRLLFPTVQKEKNILEARGSAMILFGGLEREENEEDEEKQSSMSGNDGLIDWRTSQSDNISQTSPDSPPESSASGEEHTPDVANLSPEQMLRLIMFLFDAQLACAHESGDLEKQFTESDLRVKPMAVDLQGRKFWFFAGDVWLFMEEDQAEWMQEVERPNEVKKTTKKKKGSNGETPQNYSISKKEVSEANASLFTGRRFRVVCKCAEHYQLLIDAYLHQRTKQTDIVEKLEQCLTEVQEYEREQLKKLKQQAERSQSPYRTSTRIAQMMEQRRREQEAKRVKQEAIEAERRQIEREQMREYHRIMSESDMPTPSTMSREERLKLRQQKIQEQMERVQLIEAGLLEPSAEERADETSDDEDEECKRGLSKGTNRKRRHDLQGGKAAIKIFKAIGWAKTPPVSSSRSVPFRSTPASEPISNFTYRPLPMHRSLFGTREKGQRRCINNNDASNWTPKISLIAPSSTNSSYSHFPQLTRPLPSTNFSLPNGYSVSASAAGHRIGQMVECSYLTFDRIRNALQLRAAPEKESRPQANSPPQSTVGRPSPSKSKQQEQLIEVHSFTSASPPLSLDDQHQCSPLPPQTTSELISATMAELF